MKSNIATFYNLNTCCYAERYNGGTKFAFRQTRSSFLRLYVLNNKIQIRKPLQLLLNFIIFPPRKK